MAKAIAIGAPSGKFYDDVTQTAQIPSGVTQYRQPIVIDEEYGGDSIVVSALECRYPCYALYIEVEL